MGSLIWEVLAVGAEKLGVRYQKKQTREICKSRAQSDRSVVKGVTLMQVKRKKKKKSCISLIIKQVHVARYGIQVQMIPARPATHLS